MTLKHGHSFNGTNLARYTHCNEFLFGFSRSTTQDMKERAVFVHSMSLTCWREMFHPCLISKVVSFSVWKLWGILYNWSKISNSLAKSCVSKIWAANKSDYFQITLQIFLMIKLIVYSHCSITIFFSDIMLKVVYSQMHRSCSES